MLDSTLFALVSYDWPRDDAGVPTALPAQLGELWHRAGTAGPRDGDVLALQRWLWELSTGDHALGDADAWRALVVHAQRVVDSEPLAATIAALTAVAAWCGAERPTETPGQLGAELNWGWHELVLESIGVLDRAGVFWGAQALAESAVSAMEWSMRTPWPIRSIETLEGMRSHRIALERRYRRDLAELAWAIREAVRSPGLDRTRLAATLWAAGVPDRAHALADHGCLPSLSVIADLADSVLWRGRRDPFLGYTWARMWFPGSSLREDEHRDLARRSLRHAVYSKEYEALDSMFLTHFGYSLFAAFARVLVAWFDGRVSAEERDTMDFALEACRAHPPSFVRVAALVMLITEGPDGSQRSWRTIARQAAKLAMAEQITGEGDLYDRSLDIPLYYLGGNDDEVLEQIESQRRAGLYLRPLLDDRPGGLPRAAQPLMQEQRQLLDEVKALRLLLRFSPMPHRLQLRLRQDMRQSPAEGDWWDKERAYRRLSQLVDRLAALTDQIDAVAPGYADRRRAGASVEEFAGALAP